METMVQGMEVTALRHIVVVVPSQSSQPASAFCYKVGGWIEIDFLLFLTTNVRISHGEKNIF